MSRRRRCRRTPPGRAVFRCRVPAKGSWLIADRRKKRGSETVLFARNMKGECVAFDDPPKNQTKTRRAVPSGKLVVRYDTPPPPDSTNRSVVETLPRPSPHIGYTSKYNTNKPRPGGYLLHLKTSAEGRFQKKTREQKQIAESLCYRGPCASTHGNDWLTSSYLSMSASTVSGSVPP